MSDNMQRDKNELTAKEREEVEEMKKELLDMRMYETWYTYKDMKQILGVINESKNMAIAKSDEKNVQKELLHSTNNCSRDVMPKTNFTQELETQEHNDTSQSIHSYRPNRISPIREQTAHGCSSPDFEPTITESRTSMYRDKNVDGENLFVKLQDNSNMRDNYSHNINRYVPSKSKNSLQDSNIMHSIEMKMDTHSECEQKLERWQINPLDSYVSENDVPLQEPNRPVVQDRMPFRLCKEAQGPEMLDKLIHALNNHLKQMANLWHSWHRTTSTKFQWGSPIQVRLAKNNSDKKSLSDIITEQDQMECTNKHNNERSNKRKSTLILSSNIEQCSDDEDEKIVKKQKIQSHEDTNKVLHLYKDVCTVINVENDQNLNNDNFNKDSDNIEINNCKTEPRRNTEERLSPELVSLYPRRIAPPNVRKNINKRKEHTTNILPTCSLTHVSNEKQSAISLISKEKNNILTDEEILIELEKDNVKASENIEIKPLPMKGLSRRIKNQCIVLEKIQLEKQKKIEIEKEEAQKKENEEKRKREEFYKKQIIETQKREKQKEEIEKFREERSKKWNSVVDMKSQKKVNKDQGKLQNVQDEFRLSEREEETRLLKESSTFVHRDIEIIENDSTNNVNCPICNKSFPTDKIETHAAGCEQYMTENECANSSHLKNKVVPMNSNNFEILECSVCSKFRTTNGIDYEDHVNSCLQRHEDQSINEHTSTDVINVPNSPIRCYRPISEQTDSYIDYRKQFNSNNKTHARSSKKRKR